MSKINTSSVDNMIDEIEIDNLVPVSSEKTSVNLPVLSKQKKETRPPQLRSQNFRVAIVLQIIVLVLCFFMPSMDTWEYGETTENYIWGFFFFFPAVFFCSIAGLWSLNRYLLNFGSAKPIRRLIKTFTIVAIVSFFIILLLQSLAFAYQPVDVPDEGFLYHHPADTALRTFLLILCSYSYLITGWWLARRVDDYIGGLRPLGYVMCITAGIFLLSTIISSFIYGMEGFLFSFNRFLIYGISVLMINVFSKALRYVRFTGVTYDYSKKEEPAFNQIHIMVVAAIAFLISGLAYYTNSSGYLIDEYAPDDSLPESVTTDTWHTEDDAVTTEMIAYGMPYYYDILYPENALTNTPEIDSLTWETYTMDNKGGETFSDKVFVSFDEDGYINVIRNIDKAGAVLNTCYYTVIESVLTRRTCFDYKKRNYYTDEFLSRTDNNEVWQRNFTKENNIPSDKNEIISIDYTLRGDTTFVTYYTADAGTPEYEIMAFDKKRNRLSTDYYVNDEKTKSYINLYNDFDMLTSQKEIKYTEPKRAKEIKYDIFYKTDSRGNWIERRQNDIHYPHNLLLTKRAIYYRQ